MNPLKIFYNDEHMRETVKEFMVDCLHVMTIERVMEEKPVTGIYEAHQLVEKLFNKLNELYAEKEKPVIESPR